jgi:hypothetical protein
MINNALDRLRKNLFITYCNYNHFNPIPLLPTKGDSIKYVYTDAQHGKPLCRVIPVKNVEKVNEEILGYDKEKYKEIILDAAQSVLGYFGLDRTVYGDIKNTTPRKWK